MRTCYNEDKIEFLFTIINKIKQSLILLQSILIDFWILIRYYTLSYVRRTFNISIWFISNIFATCSYMMGPTDNSYLIIKVKLPTVVGGDQKTAFSIATTPRRALVTLPSIRTLYCWVLSKEVSSTILTVFRMTQPWIEPRSPGPLANTVKLYKSSSHTCKLLEYRLSIWVRHIFLLFDQVSKRFSF